MEQSITSVTNKGLVIGLMLVILGLVTYFGDLEPNGPLQWVGYAFFIGGIIWSVYSYGKQVEHNSTFGNYFAHGFKVAAIVTVIMIIYIVIFVILFPDFKEKALDKARISMREKNMTDEQMTQALEWTRKFFMVFLIGGTLVFYLLFGAIAALIAAAITKKRPDQLAGDINQIGK